MILRVRLQDLIIDLGVRKISVPSMPDTVFKLSDDADNADRIYEGKQLLTHPVEPIVLKWGFRGAVAYMQRQLRDDPTMNSAASWSHINSSAESDVDQVEAFFRGQELPVQGRIAAFLER